MSENAVTIDEPRSLHAVAPGGFTRQFRVQFYTGSNEGWRMYGTFLHHEQAQSCAKRLKDRGLEVRILKHAICPAAA